MFDIRSTEIPLRAVWTRGKGCADLATALDPDAVRVNGDVGDACIEHRASLLVTRRLSTKFDLIPSAVPHDLDLAAMTGVAALVGGGPHSLLVAEVTARLAERTSLPGRMLCAYRTPGEQAEALTTVELLYRAVPQLEYRTVRVDRAQEVVDQLAEGEAIVVGAPGGSWLQRQVFGTGARLVAKAPAGAVVVKSAPDRVFQYMTEPHYVSPHMSVADVQRLFDVATLAVVDQGMYLGMLRMDALAGASRQESVSTYVAPVDAVRLTDPLPDAEPEVAESIPVTDESGKLLGVLAYPLDS